MYGLLADVTVVAHLVFIGFVALGGLLVLRWNRLAWLHVPCAIWAVLVEWLNLLCPLTPWEQHLRQLAGEHGYQGGFIEHYLVPLIYPASLTRPLQIVLGSMVVAINVVAYARLWFLHRTTEAHRA